MYTRSAHVPLNCKQSHIPQFLFMFALTSYSDNGGRCTLCFSLYRTNPLQFFCVTYSGWLCSRKNNIWKSLLALRTEYRYWQQKWFILFYPKKACYITILSTRVLSRVCCNLYSKNIYKSTLFCSHLLTHWQCRLLRDCKQSHMLPVAFRVMLLRFYSCSTVGSAVCFSICWLPILPYFWVAYSDLHRRHKT